MRIILLLLLLTGCGKGPNNMDPEFQPIYNQFIGDANAAGLDIGYDQGMHIEFGDTGGDGHIGWCTGGGYGDGHIVIDRPYWEDALPIEKMLLLYHELGHCVLGEKHSTNDHEIMYPYVRTILEPNMLTDLFADYGDQSK